MKGQWYIEYVFFSSQIHVACIVIIHVWEVDDVDPLMDPETPLEKNTLTVEKDDKDV